jgi:hypothetical protein
LREFRHPFNALQARALAMGVRAVDLRRNPPSAAAIARCKAAVAWRHQAVPVAVRTQERVPVLYFAVSADADRAAISQSLQQSCEEKIILVLALDDQIDATLTRLYGPDPDRVGEG